MQRDAIAPVPQGDQTRGVGGRRRADSFGVAAVQSPGGGRERRRPVSRSRIQRAATANVSAVPTIVGPDLWQEMRERPLVIGDAGKSAPAPMGLGFVITQRGPNKGIFHDGEWPGERSFAGLRGDGRSFALLINSDDGAHVGQILAATTHALDVPDGLSPPSLEWQDYGYPS